MFCPNCGTQLATGVNFCPECGTQVNNIARTATVEEKGNRVMLVSLGDCARPTALALLQQVCGYSPEEAVLIIDNTPLTVARGLSDAQARYLAQAFAEYGMEVSVYDGSGWRDWESSSTSVWDQAGGLMASVAAALGLISLDNRISREKIHRMEYPYGYNGARPPVYRLHNTLRAAPPRRVTPAAVRPPVHHAPPPPRPAPAPVNRPAVAPRPAPAPVNRPAVAPRPAPAPVNRPAQRPAPAPVNRPAQRPAPAPVNRPASAPHPGTGGPGPAHRPGTPGGRSGGGTGRRG